VALERVCRDGDLDDYRGVLGSLVAEFDIERVALAATKMAHVNTVGEADEEVIPQLDLASKSGGKKSRDRKSRDGKSRDGKLRDGKGSRGRDRRDEDEAQRDGGRSEFGGKKRAGKTGAGRKRLYIALGKDAGVRPKDVVGAIANETDLSGSDVGAIEISDRSTTVEVPAEAAKRVIDALSRTRIQGRKVKARLDRH
jgi:ATP-dependent RNA helicase DeaD